MAYIQYVSVHIIKTFSLSIFQAQAAAALIYAL